MRKDSIGRRQRRESQRPLPSRQSAPRVETLERRLALSAVPVGPEFQVNTTAFTNTEWPTVASDAAGNFVVAWVGTSDVYFRRYDASGVALGPETVVSSTVHSDSDPPVIAMNPQGDFLIAWRKTNVYARRYSAAGTPVGPETQVGSGGARQAVAIDADGDSVVTWNAGGEPGGTGVGVFARRLDETGAAQGDAFLVNTTVAGNQGLPSVVMDAAGNFVIAWNGADTDGTGDVIDARRYNAAGQPQSGEFRVNTTPLHMALGFPVLAADAAGDFVVAWTRLQPGTMAIAARRFDSAGVALGDDFQVSTTTGVRYEAAVSMNAAGDFVIAWSGQPAGVDNFESYARQFGPDGQPLGGEFQLNSVVERHQKRPQVAVDAQGDFVATWYGNGPPDISARYSVYARQFADPDATPPAVTGVNMAGVTVTPGKRLVSNVPQATVAFGENLKTTGVAGVTNPANWSLTYNGQDVSERIGSITFALVPSTNRYEATVSFTTALSADGDYALTIRDAIRDVAGNALDGNADGTAGGNYVLPFALRVPVALGPEFSVVPPNGMWQATAAAADGAFVVVWTTGDTYARLFDAKGVPRGPAWKVNQQTAGSSLPPAVAMADNGESVVVWESRPDSRYAGTLYARRYDAAGNPRGDEFAVGPGARPAVAMDATGGFVIVTDTGVARRYNAAGQLMGSSFQVGDGVLGSFRSAATAMDDDGDFVVSWQTNTDILARLFDVAGQPKGNPFQVSTTPHGVLINIPSVAMDADGDFVITWTGESNGSNSSLTAFARRYSAAGVPAGELFRPAQAAFPQYEPTVGMDADGDFVIAWASNGQDGSNEGSYARRYDAAGRPQGDEFLLNTVTQNRQRRPSVALDADGDFAVSWMNAGSSPTLPSPASIVARRYGVNERPVTTGLSAVAAVENGSAAVVELWPAFADSTDADAALTYAVVATTNPGLFASTLIDPSTGRLTLSLAANAIGSSNVTLRATDTGGSSVETTFPVAVRPSWLTVPAGGTWAISGPAGAQMLTLTSGDFVIGADPAVLNAGLSLTVVAPAGLTLDADAHFAALSVVGNAQVNFYSRTDPGGGDPPVQPTPRPIPPRLSVGGVSATEGNAGLVMLTFPVTLDRPAERVTRVRYSTANVTATKGTDYVATFGVLTFQPGEASKTIHVQVRGDTQVEGDETFRVALYDADGAAVADGSAVGTIRNDDVPVVPSFVIRDASVVEGETGLRAVVFDVVLERPVGRKLVVRFATSDGTARAGSDYVATTGTLTFGPGETRRRVTVYVKGDATKEADETFFLDLLDPSNPSGHVARGRGTIRNDD